MFSIPICVVGFLQSASSLGPTAGVSSLINGLSPRHCAISARSPSSMTASRSLGVFFTRWSSPAVAQMSKHLGNVVDPDQLVELYGADTVRLAVLYAAGPAKTLNWNDGAIRYARRFLLALWEYAQARFAAAKDASPDAEAALDTEFLRERLQKWCANGVARITSDLEDLQMHSAIRNVTRLFERIKDFEKRVLERRGALCQEDLDALRSALVLLIKCLAPFAPHLAEELLIAAGGEDGPELLGPWPEPPKILPEKKVETKLPPIASLGFGK